MCLSLAIERPGDILARGEHLGFEWMVIHNRSGYRCGYVKVQHGHPWYGADMEDVLANVHGGVTFAEADTPCDKGGVDDGYWVGFDCVHGGDAPDPSLKYKSLREPELQSLLGRYGEVRTQEYVEAECRSLCEQAAAAIQISV